MYKALTNVNTEEFGQIKEGEILTDEQYSELYKREAMFFKDCSEEEVYNPIILADEVIDEDLPFKEEGYDNRES